MTRRSRRRRILRAKRLGVRAADGGGAARAGARKRCRGGWRREGDAVRVMALEVGDMRIGVALSDPTRALATPLGAIDRAALAATGESGANRLSAGDDAELMAAADAAADIAREYGASEIVVGVPYLMSGRVGAQARSALRFAEALELRSGLAVVRVDERLSTVQARRMLSHGGGGSRGSRVRDRGAVDSAAAAVMLQAWLDGGAGAWG